MRRGEHLILTPINCTISNKKRKTITTYSSSSLTASLNTNDLSNYSNTHFGFVEIYNIKISKTLSPMYMCMCSIVAFLGDAQVCNADAAHCWRSGCGGQNFRMWQRQKFYFLSMKYVNIYEEFATEMNFGSNVISYLSDFFKSNVLNW